MDRAVGLAGRLRAETATLHEQTERKADVPESIQSTTDYSALLQSMLAFHRGTEALMAQPRWAADWVALGVVIDQHSRSSLIVEDLRALGVEPEAQSVPELQLESFAEVLGCLYVVEGSSLGGRFIGPAIIRTLGPVPTTYYDGLGRLHPAPWRSVQKALSVYETIRTDCDSVISGAMSTFEFFGHVLRSHVMLNGSV